MVRLAASSWGSEVGLPAARPYPLANQGVGCWVEVGQGVVSPRSPAARAIDVVMASPPHP